ncbi:hypothetical protein [Streptomyces sp. NPDC002692]
MIVSYRRDDGTLDEVSTDDLSAIESSVIESATGLDWDEVDTALRHQAPTAMRAVLWVFRKRQQPTLRFSEFDLPGWKRRTKAQLEYAEIFDMVEALKKNAADDEAVERMTGFMRVMAHDQGDVERAFAELAPKAPDTATPPEPEVPGPSPDAASETSSTSTGL